MLKKIKRKFLIITFASIFLVVSLIVGYINLYNYTSNLERHDKVINFVLNNNGDNNHTVEPSINRYIIVIDVINNKAILRNGNLDNNINIQELSEIILSLNEEYGNYENYKFGTKVIEDGTNVIVLSNIQRDKEISSTFFTNSLTISIIGILVVYLVIYLSSSYILRPFIKNEDDQKEFITNASHELKTPLTIIKANLDVLKIDNVDNEWTKSIDNQVSRLELLTNNLIELSKVDELEKTFMKTDFSLSDAIYEILSSYDVLFKENSIVLEKDIKSNVSFNGNEKQIRDIIKLLLDNMIKYSSNKSSIKLTENELIFSNNTELNDGNYDYIFNRFARIDNSRNQNILGYGIGLSIVKKIVELHNCTIIANVINSEFVIRIKI